MKEQNNTKRQMDSNQILQKLIKLDNRDSNFYYRDEFLSTCFKVHYPQIFLDNAHPDNMLRLFWKQVHTHYFKKIDADEQKRLQYLRKLFQCVDLPPSQKSVVSVPTFTQEPQFYSSLSSLIKEKYLKKYYEPSKLSKEDLIWMKHMYFHWKNDRISTENLLKIQKKTKKIFSKIKINRNKRLLIKKKKNLRKIMEEQEQDIDQILRQYEEADQEREEKAFSLKSQHQDIDDQIERLETELLKNQSQNYSKCQTLFEQIQNQDRSQFVQEKPSPKRGRRNRQFEEESMENQSIEKLKMESPYNLKCIQLAIKSQEEKQIAQSVAKITTSDKTCGQVRFMITFEPAMNIQPKMVSEKQLNKVNTLRETSLNKFYKTGVKSLYSYVCHNYAGFYEMLENRQTISKIADKDYLHKMKKGTYLHHIAYIQKEMEGFNVCHQCKFIYPDYMLETCRFASDKQSMPKMSSQSYQTDFSQTQTESLQKNRLSQRFVVKRKNCLTGYAKINDEFYCGRKYCKSCIKENYQYDFSKENGYCPFCEGICSCTRCLRNEKIVKLRNLYTSLGGNLTRIHEESLLQQLEPKKKQCMTKSRGRPRKYITVVKEINLDKKIAIKRKKKPISKENIYKKHYAIKNKRKLKSHKDESYHRHIVTKQDIRMFEQETEKCSSNSFGQKQVIFNNKSKDSCYDRKKNFRKIGLRRK